MADYIELTCPFCGEAEFDRIGLKNHFTSGYCDVFNDVQTVWEETLERRAAATRGKTEGDGDE